MSNQEPFKKVTKGTNSISFYSEDALLSDFGNVAEAIKELERDKAKKRCKDLIFTTSDLWRFKKIFFKEFLSTKDQMVVIACSDDRFGLMALKSWLGEEELSKAMLGGDIAGGAIVGRESVLSELIIHDLNEGDRLSKIEGLAIAMIAYGVTAVFSIDELLGLEKIHYSPEWCEFGILEELKKRNPKKKRAFLEHLYCNIITGRVQVDPWSLRVLKYIYYKHGFYGHGTYLGELMIQYENVYGS